MTLKDQTDPLQPFDGSDVAPASGSARPDASRPNASEATPGSAPGEDERGVSRRWLAIFEDRHGPGAYDQLLADLAQPCVTFAAIAKRLAVSRERVRQWQRLLLPDAPRGHERQRLCAIYRRKRRLLEDPLFRSFYRHARAFVPPGRIELIDASAGYRTRAVRIDRRVIALRDAPRSLDAAASSYLLARGRAADFLYYKLTPDDYLLLPADRLPERATTFVDRPESCYAIYKNTFEALEIARTDETDRGCS